MFTRTIEPQSFKIHSLPNALGTPNYTSNFNFLKEANLLGAKVNAARNKIQAMNERLENMKKILLNTPVESDVLIPKIKNLQMEIDSVAKVIVGGFGAKNSAASRLSFAIYTSRSAQVDITGAQKEQFKLAKEAYDAEESNLNELFANKIAALEKEFEDLGGILYNNSSSRRRYKE